MREQVDVELMSPAFEAEHYIPDRYTCHGKNISPPLNWSSIPQGTKSQALILDDPDAPNGPFTHWILYNLPPDMEELPEGYAPAQGVFEGRNDFGNSGYSGPCPPRGEVHHYIFHLYTLDQKLGLEAGVTRRQLFEHMNDHVLWETELTGLYSW